MANTGIHSLPVIIVEAKTYAGGQPPKVTMLTPSCPTATNQRILSELKAWLDKQEHQ
jgi:hypothetical protein